MNAGLHVLAQVVCALKVSVTVLAVEVSVVAFTLLVHVSSMFRAIREIAGLTVIRI